MTSGHKGRNRQVGDRDKRRMGHIRRMDRPDGQEDAEDCTGPGGTQGQAR